MKLLLPLVLLCIITAFTSHSVEAMTKSECIKAGYGCRWSRQTGGRVNGWFYEKRKEVMPPVSRSITTQTDSRPRPASLPAGAAKQLDWSTLKMETAQALPVTNPPRWDSVREQYRRLIDELRPLEGK